MNNEMIQYHFEELIKTLITLASSADRQIEIMGYGFVGDDMLIDFETHYEHSEFYLNHGLVSENQFKSINEFNDLLDIWLESQSDDFTLDPYELHNNKVWEDIRLEAKKLLEILEMDHLDLTFTRKTDGNLEWTKTKLINKGIV